jgi:hypothetical protein
MERHRFGNSDLTVSAIGLGCYGMSGVYGPRLASPYRWLAARVDGGEVLAHPSSSRVWASSGQGRTVVDRSADPDAQFDAVVRRDACIALGHRPLHRDRAAHGIDDAGKFHQQAVAGSLDDAAAVLGDLRIDELAAQRLEAFERALPRPPSRARARVDGVHAAS